jgi:hypothetical protein
MPYALDRAASRFGRDRDLFPDHPRFGPYESPYDVSHGYEQPLRRVPRSGGEAEPALFRSREEAEETAADADDE